jgi:hypothetical protein
MKIKNNKGAHKTQKRQLRVEEKLSHDSKSIATTKAQKKL